MGLQYVMGDFLFPEIPVQRGAHGPHQCADRLAADGLHGGSAYYLVPEEAETELHTAPSWRSRMFWIFLVAAGLTVVGYLDGALCHPGQNHRQRPAADHGPGIPRTAD
jgi:nitric oxide reductase subunit B